MLTSIFMACEHLHHTDITHTSTVLVEALGLHDTVQLILPLSICGLMWKRGPLLPLDLETKSPLLSEISLVDFYSNFATVDI